MNIKVSIEPKSISMFDRMSTIEVDGMLVMHNPHLRLESMDALVPHLNQFLYKDFASIGYVELDDINPHALVIRELEVPEVNLHERLQILFTEAHQRFGVHFNGKVFGVGTTHRFKVITVDGRVILEDLPH